MTLSGTQPLTRSSGSSDLARQSGETSSLMQNLADVLEVPCKCRAHLHGLSP